MTHNSYPSRHFNTQNRPPVYSPVNHFRSQNTQRIPYFQLHQQQQYSNASRNHMHPNINHAFNNNYNRYQPQPYMPYSTNHSPSNNNYRSTNKAYTPSFNTHHHSQSSSNYSRNSSSNSNTSPMQTRNYRRSDYKKRNTQNQSNYEKHRKSSKTSSKTNSKKSKKKSKKSKKKKEYPIKYNPSLIENEEYFIDKHGTDKNIPETIVFSPHYLSFNEIPLPITKHPIISKNACFNCGSDEHRLMKCIYPRDTFCINFNRHLYESYTSAKRKQSSSIVRSVRPWVKPLRYYNDGNGKRKNKKKQKRNSRRSKKVNIFSCAKTFLKHCSKNDKKSETKLETNSETNLETNSETNLETDDKVKDDISTLDAFPFLTKIPKLRIFRSTSDVSDGKIADKESEAVFQMEMKRDRDHRKHHSGSRNGSDYHRDRRAFKRDYEESVADLVEYHQKRNGRRNIEYGGNERNGSRSRSRNRKSSVDDNHRYRRAIRRRNDDQYRTR